MRCSAPTRSSAAEGGEKFDFFVPIVADAEAGFGGPLNAFELMKGMIEAGAAGVHFEDQLASEKKCGHLGGKVLVPTAQFVRTLTAARLAADVMDVPSIIVARTDANAAALLTSDIDERDHEFLTGERTPEGFFRTRPGLDQAIARGLAYAPYADLVWCETGKPDLEEAKRFAEAVHAKYPGKLLAYNCSPSFNWKRNLDDATIAKFQRELGAMGYKFQFITLAGFHALNHSMFTLASAYRDEGMSAYVRLAGGGVRQRDGRLPGDQAPARSRHRLLRRRGANDLRRRSRARLPSAVLPRRSSSRAPSRPRFEKTGRKLPSGARPPYSRVSKSPAGFSSSSSSGGPARPVLHTPWKKRHS